MANWKKITTDTDLTAISSSLTTTDQAISASLAALSGSASDARNLLGDASDYTSVYVTTNTAAISDRLYVFTSGTAVTLTLPLSPSNGDSLYISNRSGINTNVVARNGELIMGLAQDVTLDVSVASFKLTYAAGTQGWVITGAGGSGVDTATSASVANLSSSFLALSESISPLSASLTTTDQIISSSVAALSGSASDARNLLGGASDYTSIYVTADTAAISDRLYVFTSGTAFTLTLPASPSNGDSLYISNRSGITTNLIAGNGELIMSSAQNLELDTAQAAFKLTYAAGSQGWVITGAGGAGSSTSSSYSLTSSFALTASALLPGSVGTTELADDSVTYDKIEGRYTAVSTISTTTSTLNLDAGSFTSFNITANLQNPQTLNIQNMKTGQVIGILATGVTTLTLTSDDTSEIFNNLGAVTYDGASDNSLQIICVDDTDSAAIYNYTISTYTADNTPN